MRIVREMTWRDKREEDSGEKRATILASFSLLALCSYRYQYSGFANITRKKYKYLPW
jgi:hypothetical protein